MMNDFKMQDSLADLIEEQMKIIGMNKFEQDIAIVREIVDPRVGNMPTRSTAEPGSSRR